MLHAGTLLVYVHTPTRTSTKLFWAYSITRCAGSIPDQSIYWCCTGPTEVSISILFADATGSLLFCGFTESVHECTAASCKRYTSSTQQAVLRRTRTYTSSVECREMVGTVRECRPPPPLMISRRTTIYPGYNCSLYHVHDTRCIK